MTLLTAGEQAIINSLTTIGDILRTSSHSGAGGGGGGGGMSRFELESRRGGSSSDRADRFYADTAKTYRQMLNVNNKSLTFLDQISKNSKNSLNQEFSQINSIEKLNKTSQLAQAAFNRVAQNIQDQELNSGLFKELITSGKRIETFADVLTASERAGDLANFAQDLVEAQEKIAKEFADTLADPAATPGALQALYVRQEQAIVQMTADVGLTDIAIAELGLEVGRIDLTRLDEVADRLREHIQVGSQFNRELENSVKFLRTFEEGLKSSSIVVGVAALKGLDSMNDAAREAAKFGGTIQWSTDAIASSGLTMKELIETQGEFRQSVMALGEGFDGHTDMLLKDQDALYSHIGSISGVSKANAAFLDLSQTISGTKDKAKISSLMTMQGNTFKRLNNTLGMTADQFIDLNSTLFTSGDAIAHFYNTDGQDREKYAKGLYAQYEKMTTVMGMTADAARNAATTLQSLSAEDAQDQLAKGAKLAAMAGAMGMGDQAQMLQDAIASGNTNTPEFLETLKQLDARISAEASKSTGNRMVVEGMINQMDIGSLVGKNGILASAANAEGKQMDPILESNKAIIGGLPRSGSEAMEDVWKKSSVIWDKGNVMLSQIAGNMSLLVGFLGSKILGPIFGPTLARAGQAATETLTGTASDVRSAARSPGMAAGIKNVVKLGLQADLIIGVASGLRDGLIESNVRDDVSDTVSEFATSVGSSITFGLTDALFDAFNIDTSTITEAIGNTKDHYAMVMNDVNDQIGAMSDESKDRLGKLENIKDANFIGLTEAALSKMSDVQLKEKSDQFGRVAEAIEASGDNSKETQVLLKELVALQQHVVDLGKKSIDEQKKTTDEIKKKQESENKAFDDYKSKYLRAQTSSSFVNVNKG